jgi:ligand-binding sensor domain-containing protein
VIEMFEAKTHTQFVLNMQEQYPDHVIVGIVLGLDGQYKVHEWDGEAHAVQDEYYFSLGRAETLKDKRERHFREIGRKTRVYRWFAPTTMYRVSRFLGQSVVEGLKLEELAVVIRMRFEDVDEDDAMELAQLTKQRYA